MGLPDPKTLRSFTPFAELDDDQLILLAGRIETVLFEEGALIFSIGDQPGAQHFLLNGVVELEAGDGTRRSIESGSERARTALCPERPCAHNTIALDSTILLRVDPSLLDMLQDGSEETSYSEGSTHPVLQGIRDELRTGSFSLPSLPEVALRIKRALESESASVARITKIVSADPVITAKLIKAANSPLYRGAKPIESCQSAIVRLGLDTTKQLVISFALRDLFQLKDAALKKRMQQTWRHSTEIAAISMVLARMTKHLETEQALLAGLVHDIGVISILSYIRKHPGHAATPQDLDGLIQELRGEVGGMILRHWNFSDVLVQAAVHAYDWHRESGKADADYCDLVIIAQLHSLMKTGKLSELPPIEQIPAYAKIDPEVLTPQASLKVIDQARDQFGEVLKLLA